MPKIIFAIFSFILLIYVLLPSPNSIEDFPPLPDSTKSTLSGDTWQVPNVVGYFSNNYRGTVIPFYYNFFQSTLPLPFLPLRLNYPPEFAYTAIKDQTHSTYLEEFVYPLRTSLYVNGLEPFYEDGTPKFKGSTTFEIEDKLYNSKVTLRYYPSPLWTRVIVWLGITICAWLLILMMGRIFRRD